MRITVAAAVFLVGCRFDLPVDYDSTVRCTESRDSCVCVNQVCVQCTVADERNCGGTQPQCGPDNLCRACRANDDCDSGACLEDGACAPQPRVIYAAPNGVNTPGCGAALGQNECSITQALIEVATPREIIRLAPGAYTVGGADGLDFSAKSATVVARGATINRVAPNGAIMTARNGQTLKLIGGTLQGPNNTTDGLKCNTDSKLLVYEVTFEGMTQSAIETDACELTISRSTIRKNLQGGINMVNTARVATITNNFVCLNGGFASPVGGMVLRLATGSKIEFNTVVDNTANPNGTTAGGIACDGPGYDAPHNLVYRNQGGTDGQVQVYGTCTFMGSYQKSAGSVVENAVGFEKPNDPTNPSYRLTAQSPPDTIKDAFDCSGLVDFEGDPRPQPTTDGKCDFGADEFRIGQ